MIPKPLAVAIVCLVTLVWAGNFLAQFLVSGYSVDGWIHSIFLTVVGGALVASRRGGALAPEDEGPGTPATVEPPEPPPPPTRPASGAHRARLILDSFRFTAWGLAT